MELVSEDPVRVARELSEARPHVSIMKSLRRRLSALPWERDIELAMEVELHIKQPQRLAHLTVAFLPSRRTSLVARLKTNVSSSSLATERTHPTLVPVPEQEERPVSSARFRTG